MAEALFYVSLLFIFLAVVAAVEHATSSTFRAWRRAQSDLARRRRK